MNCAVVVFSSSEFTRVPITLEILLSDVSWRWLPVSLKVSYMNAEGPSLKAVQIRYGTSTGAAIPWQIPHCFGVVTGVTVRSLTLSCASWNLSRTRNVTLGLAVSSTEVLGAVGRAH